MSKGIAQFSSKNIFKFLYTCSSRKHEGNFQGLKDWKFWHTIFFLMPCLLRLLVHVCITTVKKGVPRNNFFRNPTPNRVPKLSLSYL